MRVRAVQPSDLPEVALLVQTSFDARLRRYMTYAQRGIEAFLAVFVERPELFPERTYLVCADEVDRVVGYAEFSDHGDGTYFLSYICVARDMRRRGIASAMIEGFISSRPPEARLELEVFRQNTSAIAAYRKLGFAQSAGERTWLQRSLPAALPRTSGRLAISSLAAYEPMHAAYGFSELPVRWSGRDVKLGRIGAGVLRCFSPDAFGDEDLLAAVRRVFPSLTEAFVILDGRPSPESVDRATIVAETVLMARGTGRMSETEGVVG